MKLNYLTKGLSTLGRWIATGLFCVSAIAFIWHGAFFVNSSAMASPTTNLIAAADLDDAKSKASEDAGRTKGFVQETRDKLKETAKTNANKVDDATDNGSFVGRKAQRDAARIQERADQDADRTQKAIDDTKNVVERAVEGIKDAFK
ncbi:MAG: hypothetical protein PUP90_30500 [Nostoc sp. S4]|nr:hypothetical protein [Nostoc sp. S4]